MWMMGYSNPTSTTTTTSENNGVGVGASHEFSNNMSLMISPAESFNNGRKLRPLAPRPTAIMPPLPTTCFNNNATCDTSALFALNRHLAPSHHHHMVGDQQGKRDFSSAQSAAVSSRWNPTPEQLSALEDLYKRGTRTPSAEQIQQITAQIRKYGKIEGKNVFYWFQNHKARERQKRRRQLNHSSPNDHQLQKAQDDQNRQTKEAGYEDQANNKNNNGTTGFEMEQTKLWPSSTNCSTLADQEPAVQQAEKTAAECVTDDEWVQFQDHHNSLQIVSKTEATTIWQGNNDDHEEHIRRRTSLNLLEKNATWNINNPNIFLPSSPATSFSEASFKMHHILLLNDGLDDEDQEDDQCNKEGALTLELFPLRSNGKDDGDEKGTHLTPYQFFEFLPLKNSV